MSNFVVLAFVSTSLLMAADPGAPKKSKESPQTGQASRMVIEKEPTVIVGNEKTVGASPESYVFPAVADNDPIGNAKTVGGSRNITKASADGVGKVGNSKTVGDQ